MTKQYCVCLLLASSPLDVRYDYSYSLHCCVFPDYRSPHAFPSIASLLRSFSYSFLLKAARLFHSIFHAEALQSAMPQSQPLSSAWRHPSSRHSFLSAFLNDMTSLIVKLYSLSSDLLKYCGSSCIRYLNSIKLSPFSDANLIKQNQKRIKNLQML